MSKGAKLRASGWPGAERAAQQLLLDEHRQGPLQHLLCPRLLRVALRPLIRGLAEDVVRRLDSGLVALAGVVLPAATILAPLAANPSAVARPIPLPAPVTTTSLFPNGFCASLMGLPVFVDCAVLNAGSHVTRE